MQCWISCHYGSTCTLNWYLYCFFPPRDCCVESLVTMAILWLWYLYVVVFYRNTVLNLLSLWQYFDTGTYVGFFFFNRNAVMSLLSLWLYIDFDIKSCCFILQQYCVESLVTTAVLWHWLSYSFIEMVYCLTCSCGNRRIGVLSNFFLWQYLDIWYLFTFQ